MSGHIFIASERLPETVQEKKFWKCCKELMTQICTTEEGGIEASCYEASCPSRVSSKN